MKKSIISGILVFFMLIGAIGPTRALAEDATSPVSSQKEIVNFQLINDDLNNYEYTFEKGGESFRIVEKIDLNNKEVFSKTFKKNNEGDYVLDSEISSKMMKDTSLLISTKQNGITTNETISPTVVSEAKDDLSKIEGVNDLSDSKAQLQARSDLTDWQYQTTTKGSTLADKLTVGAISIVISALVPYAAVKIVTQIANLYYQLNTPNIYYSKQWYYRYTLTNPPLPRAERSFTYFYKDSSYSDFIYNSPVMTENYTPGWGP